MEAADDGLRNAMAVDRQSFRGALASRDFAFLFYGQLCSEIGNGLIQLALPWLVLQLTGSAFQLGFAYFIQFLPVLLFGLVGGVFVDRFDRRLTIFVVDAVRAVAFISVGAIYYFGSLTVPYLYAIIFIEALLANLFNPARAALMPNLVDAEHLRPANSLMEVSRQIGFLVAPGVGGVLVAKIGPAAMFLADGVSFGISAVTVFLIKHRQPRGPRVVTTDWRHAMLLVITETGGGLSMIKRSRLLQVAILLGISLNLIVAPIQVLLPLFVRDVKHSDASYFALLFVGFIVGSIVGTLAAPSNARRFGIGPLAIGAITIIGCVICIAPWPPYDWVPLIAMAIAGGAIGTLFVAQTTLIQGSTTDEERGRVSAASYTANLGIRPLGFLLIGGLASVIPVRFLFSALGLLALCVALVLSQSSDVRKAR
jgi:MFS family permease